MRFVAYLSLLLAALGVLILSAHAQTVVPFSSRFPPPSGLSFAGDWECRNGDQTARMHVTPDRVIHRHLVPSNQAGLALVTESQEGLVEHYLVGYDRDANEFLLLDVDDPSYESFRPEGWTGSTMTLTFVASPVNQMPPNRFVYHVENSVRFTVSWEEYEGSEWRSRDTYVCTKSSRKGFQSRFRSHCPHW